MLHSSYAVGLASILNLRSYGVARKRAPLDRLPTLNLSLLQSAFLFSVPAEYNALNLVNNVFQPLKHIFLFYWLNEKKERNLIKVCIISWSLNETLQPFLKYYPEL